jgi:hypothetical protein
MMQDRNDQDSADTWYPHLCTIPTFQILTKPYCLIALLPHCLIALLPHCPITPDTRLGRPGPSARRTHT